MPVSPIAARVSDRPPPARPARRSPLGVDRHDDALAAEALAGGADEVRVLHRGGVDRHLVGAGVEQVAHVLQLAHAAADGERHEHRLGRARHHVEDDLAPLVRRRDVEEGQLVGALLVVALRDLDRVAGVAQADEVDALDDAAVLDVEAGDDALGQHGTVDSADRASLARACAVTRRIASSSLTAPV